MVVSVVDGGDLSAFVCVRSCLALKCKGNHTFFLHTVLYILSPNLTTKHGGAERSEVGRGKSQVMKHCSLVFFSVRSPLF